ncbi:hypothetical protein [Ereboglobus luteus]|uniref:hypothetical protein n=1 Tax=Ereboglobus luteus TaxID=1796921 RepID=UPI001F42137C|nr:hypothetical protein [Ereboglobus luteus]
MTAKKTADSTIAVHGRNLLSIPRKNTPLHKNSSVKGATITSVTVEPTGHFETSPMSPINRLNESDMGSNS